MNTLPFSRSENLVQSKNQIHLLKSIRNMAMDSKPVYYDEVNHSLTRVLKEGIFNLSSIDNYEGNCKPFGFGIKFVTEGVERYRVNNQLYTIREGNYLLVNGENDTLVQIDSKKHVQGMCIHISEELISEVVASFRAPDAPISDLELSNFFYTEAFLENKYNAQHNHLGNKLIELEQLVRAKEFHEEDIQKELFYDLASVLVSDQTVVFKELQNIKSVKQDTKKDLLRRVYLGKEYIDSCFEQYLTIEQIAQNSGMSEFHFFRLFRQTIGISPYQYILMKRFQKSLVLLAQGMPVSAVAMETGFSSIHTFSKSFKKMFGVTPSNFLFDKNSK